MKRLPIKQLWEWWNNLATEEIELERRFKPLVEEYEEIRNRRAKLEQLIMVEEGMEEGRMKIENALIQLKTGELSTIIERHPTDVVWDILVDTGTPIHYRTILSEMLARGVSVGGKDPGSTLIAYMGRDKRFVKAPEKGRGFWKLKEWENAQIIE